jgi:hypothetical protein
MRFLVSFVKSVIVFHEKVDVIFVDAFLAVVIIFPYEADFIGHFRKRVIGKHGFKFIYRVDIEDKQPIRV